MSSLVVLGAITGVSSLVLYFHTIPLRSLVDGKELGIIFDRLALHLWFLESILIITALVLTILGVVGYESIKDEATKQAVKQAESRVREYLRSSVRGEDTLGSGGETADTGDVKKEESDA